MRQDVTRRVMRMAGHYRSLAGFYRADPRRVASHEFDVGLWWREQVDGRLHRAAWIDDTGELYLVRLGPESDGGGTVEVLAHVSDRDQLESALEGWREQCGEPNSLAWLRGRAATLEHDGRGSALAGIA